MSVDQKKKPLVDNRGNLKQLEKRWTKELVGAGWTAIPNVLLEKQNAFGLKPMELNLILQIAKYWWDAGSAPFPSVKTLAETIGVTPRTVQKNLAELEEKGMIEKKARYYAQGGQKSNEYTFQGLIVQCKPFAEEMVAERKRKKNTEKAIKRRTTPLKAVK